jgi:hypothetical protein
MQLQQEKDPKEWGVDVGALQRAMQQGGLEFKRVEVVDFDPDSLRKVLPRAVREIARSVGAGRKARGRCSLRVRVDCVALRERACGKLTRVTCPC